MLALAIELLGGRYVATAYNDRDRVEWPPHPCRLFSALVATWADGDPGSRDGKQELEALQWLERQAAPDIYASDHQLAGFRDVVPIFVPVNDASIVSAPDRDKLDASLAIAIAVRDERARTSAEKDVRKLTQKLSDDTARAVDVPKTIGKGDVTAALRLLPERRVRQPRTFPSATPEEPTVAFVWDQVDVSNEVLLGLERLLRRLIRLGHSSTLVAARTIDAAAVLVLASRTTRFVPNEQYGTLVIRWVSSGQVERLTRAFRLHGEFEPRVLPAHFVRYTAGEAGSSKETPRSIFQSDFIVLARVGGPRLPSTSAAGLSRQIRRAIMSFAEQPVVEMLSGHQPDGSTTQQPHLAIVPLPVVGNEFADGAILGVALILPAECAEQERRAVLKAVAEFERHSGRPDETDEPTLTIHLGEVGDLELQRLAWGETKRSSLQGRRWTRASRRWASVTPVALDRNPGELHHPDSVRRQAAFDEATDTVREAVRRVVPQGSLTAIDVVRSCVVPGTAKPRNFPRFPSDTRRTQRVLVHVRLVFSEAVTGPLLIGAGRYQGLGLCLPVDVDGNSSTEKTS